VYSADVLSRQAVAASDSQAYRAVEKHYYGLEHPKLLSRRTNGTVTFNKLSPFQETLEQALKANSFQAKHNHRSAKALFEQIKAAATASSPPSYARGAASKASFYGSSYRRPLHSARHFKSTGAKKAC